MYIRSYKPATRTETSAKPINLWKPMSVKTHKNCSNQLRLHGIYGTCWNLSKTCTKTYATIVGPSLCALSWDDGTTPGSSSTVCRLRSAVLSFAQCLSVPLRGFNHFLLSRKGPGPPPQVTSWCERFCSFKVKCFATEKYNKTLGRKGSDSNFLVVFFPNQALLLLIGFLLTQKA